MKKNDIDKEKNINTVTIDNPILLQDLLSLMNFCTFPVLITGLGEVCYWHGKQVTVEEFLSENDHILKEYGDKKVFSIGQTANNNVVIVLSHTSGKF